MADGYIKIVVSVSRGVKSTVVSTVSYNSLYPYIELGGKLDGTGIALKDYSASLREILYDKAMFKPGFVKLTLAVTHPSGQHPSLKSTVDGVFFDKVTFLDLIGITDGCQAGQASYSDVVYLARNYYIQGYDLCSSSVTESKLVLKCYSFDRKLTLSKYSRVYTGKTLANGILKDGITNQLSSFKTHLDDIIKKEKSSGELSENDSIYHAEKDCLSNINVTNLLLTGYKEEIKTKSGENDVVTSAKRTLSENNKELKHPYLVQYNESLYDFISREAHKCGEFFYFENGRITVGLPKSCRERIFLGEGDTYQYTPYSLTPLCSFSSVMEEESESQISSGITPWYGDYINTPVNSSADVGKMYYSPSYTSDEALHVVTEKDNRYGIKGGPLLGTWILYSALGKYFSAETFWDGLLEAVGFAAWDLINMGAIIPKLVLEPDYVKKHIKDDKNDNKNTSEINNLVDNTVDLWSTSDIANLCNKYFHTVEGWEKTAAETKVTVNLESTLRKLYLGSCVILSNMDGNPDCVVVSMHGEYSSSGITNSIEAVPIIDLSADAGSLSKVAVPVAGQVDHILKAYSMEAIVTDDVDPLRLGRVRVRYPWSQNSEQSPWIRVEVPFTGGDSDSSPGFCMTPSKGEHVMLGYVDGNIELPFVSGSLYYLTSDRKKDRIPPVGDSAQLGAYFKTDHQIRTIASGKGHALVFQDFPNTSLISQALPAVGTLTQFIKAVQGKSVSFEKALPIQGGSVTLRDGTGITTICLSPNSREITINSSLGKVTMNAFTGITINAPNGDVKIKGKNISLEAGNNITIQAGKNIKDNTGAWKESLGSMFGKLVSSAIVGGIKNTGVGLGSMLDLSFLRSCLETFLRPVEGTLSLRSKRNAIMTAGKGKVTIPSNLMSNVKTWKSAGGNSMTEFNKLSDKYQNDDVILSFLKTAFKDVDSYYLSFMTKYTVLSNNVGKLSRFLKNNGLTETAKQLAHDFLDERDTEKKAFTKAKEDKEITKEQIFPGYLGIEGREGFGNMLRSIYVFHRMYKQYVRIINDSYSYLKDHRQYVSFEKDKLASRYDLLDECVSKSAIVKGLKENWAELNMGLLADNFDESFFTGTKMKLNFVFSDSVKMNKELIKKYIAVKTLLNYDKFKIYKDSVSEKVYSTFDTALQDIVNGDQNDWQNLLSLIVLSDDDTRRDSATKGLYNFGNNLLLGICGNPVESFDKLTNRNGASGPRSWSDPGSSGGDILLSTKGESFLQYSDASKTFEPRENSNLSAIKEFITNLDRNEPL